MKVKLSYGKIAFVKVNITPANDAQRNLKEIHIKSLSDIKNYEKRV